MEEPRLSALEQFFIIGNFVSRVYIGIHTDRVNQLIPSLLLEVDADQAIDPPYIGGEKINYLFDKTL